MSSENLLFMGRREGVVAPDLQASLPKFSLGELGQQIGEFDKYTQWIDTNLLDFQGNKENAGLLLQKFIEGFSYVYRKYNGKTARLPELVIVKDDEGKLPIIFYSKATKNVVMCQDYLEKYSLRNPRAIWTDRDDNNNTYFQGSITSNFFYGGVEEGDHADFFQKNPQQEIFTEDCSIAQYDSQPHELRSLYTRLEYARAHKTQLAIGIFEHRIAAAEAFLAQQ